MGRLSIRDWIVQNASGLPGASAVLSLARLPIAFTAGPEHTVRYVNAALCSMLGKTSDELVGGPCVDVLPKGVSCRELLDRVYQTGKPDSHIEEEDAESHPGYWSYEVWPISTARKDGGADGVESQAGVMIMVTETTLFHQQATAMNEALLLSSVHQHELADAAETLNTNLQLEMRVRKLAEAALLRSEKLASVGRMAASISHEINNPLAAVVNTLFLALNSPGLPAPVREYLEIADGETKRIAHIARQTLGFYHESSAPTTNSVAALFNSVVDLFQSKIRAKRAIVRRQYRGDLQVTGIFGELRQVLSNLLVNGLDAIDDEGTVVLRASAAHPNDGGSRVRISVSDNGEGIDAVAMKQLFEPFFTTKGSIGTGLGLWVSDQLIKKQAGMIHVRSCTSGARKGTTFSLLLPGGVAVAKQENELSS